MGNLALGTTDSKNYKLNVDGSVSFSNFVNFSNAITQTNNLSSNIFMGNVGIGTSSHTSNLAVQGSSFITGIASFSNSIYQSNVFTSNILMGNVSIGTGTITTHKLNVLGNLNATSFSGDGGTITNINTNNIVGNALAVNKGGTGATSLTLNKLLLGNDTGEIIAHNNLTFNKTANCLEITSTLQANKIGIGGSDFTSNLYIGAAGNSVIIGNLGIGTTNVTSNLTVQGRTFISDIASFSNSIYQSNVSTSNILMGNVSIGTVGISTHKLNVLGNVNATSFSGDGTNITNVNTSNIVGAALAVNKGGTGMTSYTANQILYANTGTSLITSGNLTFDGNILALNSANTGIPSSVSNWSGARIILYSAGSSNYPYALGYNTNSFIFSIPNTGAFNWYSDSNVIMNLTNQGDLSVIRDVIAFNNLSDINLKTNIKPLNINCIDIINKINPVEFTWKNIDDIISNKRNKIDYGFIAQEIELLIPSLIYDSKYMSKYKLIKYDKFAPYFVKALQELHKIIQEQKSYIQELKTELENIKSILSRNNLS
jgi:hypothetical protein